MLYLRQSTSVTRRIGKFVDDVDAKTAETALTITPALRKLSKNGAAFAATSDGSNAIHDTDGYYSCTLTTTDTNTAGDLILQAAVSGALPVEMHFEVLPGQVYDAKFIHPLIAYALPNAYGQLQGGGVSAATLPSTASSVNDHYNGRLLVAYGGAGAGQVAYIDDYVGSSRGCVLAETLPTAFDNTTLAAVVPFALLSSIAALADAVLDEQCTGALSAFNARPTLRQGIAELVMGDRNVTQSTNNLLTKDTDGTTTIRTRALSPNATTPTSRSVTA